MSSSKLNPRITAVDTLLQVVSGRSLNAISQEINNAFVEVKDRALCREIVYGVLRQYQQLQFYLKNLLDKPVKAKDQDIEIILMIGLYQLYFMRIPDHAALNETVKLAQVRKKNWAKGLINAVLRNAVRRQSALQIASEANPSIFYSHPTWIVDKIQRDWPVDWQQILQANNVHAPMILRVNVRRNSVNDYLEKLKSQDPEARVIEFTDCGVVLSKPCDVNQLPGFREGLVSVQDAAAQLAESLLDIKSGQFVLDACAAPGGKTAAILEKHQNINLLAIDSVEERVDRIKETLARLMLNAEVKVADARETDSWFEGNLFDRILLDAPCSASGVIRRNPDIKIHRKLEDIPQLVENQRLLLDRLWQVLKPGGIVLYATCSIFKEENEFQIAHFLANHKDAVELRIDESWGRDVPHGRQIFPGDNDMDGFYYAKLQKLYD